MRSLQAKMFVVFALIATLPLLALSYLALDQTRDAMIEQVGLDHEQTAQAAAGLVTAVIETARAQLRGEALALQDEAAANGSWSEALEEARVRAPAFDALWVADASGRVVAGEPRPPAAAQIEVPIDPTYRLVGNLSSEPLQRSLARLSSGEERVFIVEADDPLAALADEHAVGHVRQEDRIVAFARLDTAGWVVIDAVPIAQALAPLVRVTAVIVVLSGGLMGGILLASVLVARRVVAPVRELTEAASALAAGNLSKRISPKGADEIGELARTFNQMAERISESLEGLRRSETRYRGLVESANDVIFTLQPDGAIAFLSPLAKRLFGSHVGHGTAATEVVHADDRAAFEGAVLRVFDKGEPSLFVPFRVLASDATPRLVLANFTPVFEQTERPARVLVVARDVTEERRQELYREKSFLMARLVSEERDLEKLASRGLSILTAFLGARGGAVLLSRAGELRDVATSGESVPRASALSAFADAAVVRTSVRNGVVLAIPLLEQNEVLGVVALVGDPRSLSEGEQTDFLASLAAQLAVGLRRSLFEARLKEYAAELESRVAARTAELTAKSQEMESFLYSVSHDLKAPLISMQGYSQALEEDYGTALQGEGKQFLERIRKNATHMESLILDILELSRIGRVHENVERVELDAVVAEVSARVADRLRQEGGTLVVQPHLPVVHGERKRLEQLFANLVDNAIKYRHPERAARIEVRAHASGAEAIVSVSDNGRGVPARFQDQMFNIFQRVPAPGLPDPGGTGMGLAIVKRIAETHGGRVWVDSREGQGTTFHVALPLEEGP